ncbi:MAG: sigma-70 family RNA polymerase sigma factor [Chloroflexota bacterium]
MDDSSILALLKSDQPQPALGLLFEKYADQVYHLALGLLRDADRAEDVVQDTFLAAYRSRQQFEGRSALGTWLYRIAYNAAMDRLRAREHQPIPEEDADCDEETAPLPKEFIEWRWTPEELLSDQETRQALEDAVARLSPALRAVFLLRDVEDLSTEETAAILSITPSAVKVRLHRARLELREILAGFFAAQEEGALK